MLERQRGRVIAGTAIIAFLTVFCIVIFSANVIRRAVRDTFRVTAVFDAAPDVVAGTEVWIAGVPAGEVIQAGFLPVTDTTNPIITLTLELDDKHRDAVRTDSDVRLTKASAVGGAVVAIMPGSSTARRATETDTLRAESTPMAADAMNAARQFSSQLDTFLADARTLSAPVSSRMTQYTNVMRSLQTSSISIANIQSQLGARATQLREIDIGGTLDRLNATMTQVNTGLRRYSGSGDEGLAQAVARVSQRAQRVSAEMALLQTMMSPNGTLARMSNDTAIIRTLHNVQVQLDSLIAETRANPMRFWF